jgi:hypothetical protein
MMLIGLKDWGGFKNNFTPMDAEVLKDIIKKVKGKKI